MLEKAGWDKKQGNAAILTTHFCWHLCTGGAAAAAAHNPLGPSQCTALRTPPATLGPEQPPRPVGKQQEPLGASPGEAVPGKLVKVTSEWCAT